MIEKCEELTALIQIKTDIKSFFHYRPAVYSVQLEVKPVLSLCVRGCCVVTVESLKSAYRSHCNIKWLCKARLFINFPQNEFKQKTSVSEEESANTVFLGRTFYYTTERSEESL